MKTIFPRIFLLIVPIGPIAQARAEVQPSLLEIDAATLEDKIRGGMLAQVIGNLNGLPHEFKYIDEAGSVSQFTPSLPEGAYTDDDTDIEWVYLREIAKRREPLLGPEQIASLWKRHINRRIWAANRYARDLMELGFEPPWTGNEVLNPFAEFNISGQFVCESFGLMAPAMPQTAARIGLNYTHVTIDGEPAQTTQLFTTMIAVSFVETDIDRILDAGMAAIDPKCRVAKVVSEVRRLHRENLEDWRQTRRAIRDRWQTHGGGVRDRNGYELNTASTVAALLYGNKDFCETLRHAFNFGWDADNNAATAATVVGVMRGRRWMNEQGWNIADRYKNTSRDDMPTDETLTGLEDTLLECARLVIQEHSGRDEQSSSDRGQGPAEDSTRGRADAPNVYRIRRESAANIEPLVTGADQLGRVRKKFEPGLERDLAQSGLSRARAAYVVICLGEVEKQRQRSPRDWSAAVAELQKHPAIVRQVLTTTAPNGRKLREEALRAGLQLPAEK